MKKDYVFVTLRIILPNFLTVRQTFLGAARFRSTLLIPCPIGDLETLKTLRAQRQGTLAGVVFANAVMYQRCTRQSPSLSAAQFFWTGNDPTQTEQMPSSAFFPSANRNLSLCPRAKLKSQNSTLFSLSYVGVPLSSR